MAALPTHRHAGLHLSRRELLQAGLAAGATLSTWPLSRPSPLWGADAGQPKPGGILRVWGSKSGPLRPASDPQRQDAQRAKLVHSTLVRHKVGAGGCAQGPSLSSPHLAERWEALDDTTYVFYLRKGVQMAQ